MSSAGNFPVRTITDGAILLLLHRLLKVAVTFCTFKKIIELMTAQRRHWEQQTVCKKKKKLMYAKTGVKYGKEVLICASCINENLTYCLSTEGLPYCLDELQA
jgi:hypothetical protein